MLFPPAEAEAVRTAYQSATAIGEYGVGGSTVYAAEHCRAQLRSIESDPAWVEDCNRHLAERGIGRPGLDIRWCDIGPTGPWGRPAAPKNWPKFWTYPMALWQGGDFAPDVVLIDGRFRLACFAATLLMCRRPLTLLFDDYGKRTDYHRAEELCPRVGMIGRMAMFEVAPRPFGNDDFARMLPWFFSFH